APGQTAAAWGVAVSTIESRVQRGLSMLREQLDGQRDSVDWRAGLTAAFVDKAGTATAWSVVWLMSAWTKTAVAAVVVVVACMGWWAMQARSSAPPVVLTSAAAADLAATVAEPVANSDVASGAAERLIAPPLPVARRGGATLTGRCVDPAHAPLADCVVTLRGYPLGAATPQEWTDLAQLSTGTDGRFAITFAPPPSFRFALQIDVVGRVGAVANWREL